MANNEATQDQRQARQDWARKGCGQCSGCGQFCDFPACLPPFARRQCGYDQPAPTDVQSKETQ